MRGQPTSRSGQPVIVRREKAVSVRALIGGYLAASFVAAFLAALSIYFNFPYAAAASILIALVFVPLLWFFDRITFDGRRIKRSGLVSYVIARATGTRDRLKASDIEQVETIAFPGL